jgi:large subunit ribosomal protein L16
MLFVPKKTKFKKYQKGKLLNRIKGGLNYDSKLRIGSYGLKSISFGNLQSKQLETLKQILTKIIKKEGIVIIPIFPSISNTKKPIEVRMGKGKGPVNHWVFKVKIGVTICEIITENGNLAQKALKIVQKKLNIKTKII